jgi:hypothetical protein
MTLIGEVSGACFFIQPLILGKNTWEQFLLVSSTNGRLRHPIKNWSSFDIAAHLRMLAQNVPHPTGTRPASAEDKYLFAIK